MSIAHVRHTRGWDVEAEAANFCGSGKKVPLPIGPFKSNIKSLNVVQFFAKNRIKLFVQETNICKETFLKVCGLLDYGPPLYPINSKMNH